jgi:hypothetical protein
MANEFVARRGIIVQSGGARITGSLLVGGTIDATGHSLIASSITGSFSGSIGNATTASYVTYDNVDNKPPGIVSSSTQVKPLLPGGTVTSSAQFPGWVTASSQIDYNSITNKLSGVISSSTQFNALGGTSASFATTASFALNATIPAGTVSASSQVDITATTGYSTFSSSLATVDAGQTTRIDNLASATSSYAINATIQGQLAGVVSSSTQVKPLLPGGTVSSSNQVIVQNTTGIGALATTGSNTFQGNQTITGSLLISQDLIVQGSSSITFISQSTLDIGTNIITVNTLTPGTRFGGLSVIDSGSSPQRSGSLFFDSINDQWIFVHQNTAGGITSSVVLMGPATFNNIGNETSLTQNRLLKGAGLEHITDSQITDNGITVSITNGLSVGTNLTASNATITGLTANQAVFTDANDTLISVATTGTGDVVRAASPTLTGTLTAANITATGTMLLAGIISQSSQVSITGTTGYSTFSSSLATVDAGQTTRIDNLASLTSSYAINSTIQSQLAGVVSSSTQVKPLLPGGTVTSSAQFPGWVTASSQIALASITGTTFSSSNFTFPQQLTVSGVLSGSTSAFINNTLYSGSIVTGIVGPVTNQVVAALSTGSFNSAFFDYTINDGTNYRAGTVMSVWSAGGIEFTETSTADLGNTAQATFTVDILTGVARLRFSNTSGTWVVKTTSRAL